MAIVVLGLGSIGRRHARNLMMLGQNVVGFDVDAAARKAFEESGGKAVADRTEALELATGGGAVIIASPSGRHFADTLDALSAGCHVFVEKPFAHRLDGLEAAVRTAQSKGQTVFAAHNLRYHPMVQAAHEILAASALGEIFWARAICASYLPDWRPQQDYRQGYAADPATGGVIFDVIHEFDLCAHLIGPFRSVSAAAQRSGHLELNSEDIADIRLEHDCGAATMLHFDYVTRPPVRVMDITGENGRIEIDIAGRRLIHWTADGRIVLNETAVSSLDDDYRDEMKHFLECVDGLATPRCDGGEALEVLSEVITARAMAGLSAG